MRNKYLLGSRARGNGAVRKIAQRAFKAAAEIAA